MMCEVVRNRTHLSIRSGSELVSGLVGLKEETVKRPSDVQTISSLSANQLTGSELLRPHWENEGKLNRDQSSLGINQYRTISAQDLSWGQTLTFISPVI